MNKKKENKGSKITIDKLAIMMNNNFDRLEAKMDTKFEEAKEDIKDIRKDILNLGDRFVTYHLFDQLASRVNSLEKKQK